MKTWRTRLEVRPIVHGEAGPPQVLAFVRRSIYVGTAPDVALPLQGEGVSALHCVLDIDEAGRIAVEDLRGPVGTRVNGRAITGRTPLSPGDEIGVAAHAIRLLEPPQELPPTWQLTFEVTSRGGASETVVLRADEIWIGRSRERNDLVLPTGNVARRHCRVEVGGDGIATVTDSGATNGTFLNGRKATRRAPMRAGDCLFVGDFVLKMLREPERIG